MPGATREGQDRSPIGLALAGGGPLGAIYEIGALRALEESVEGLDLNDLDIYVGVSAGAFISANLANRLTATQMARALLKHEPGEHPFVTETFFRPAFGEFLRRASSVPRLVTEALWHFASNPRDLRLLDAFTRLGRALPVAVFDNQRLQDYLERIYSIKDRTDDFRRLDHRLIIVATELDSGRAVRFGSPGLDHVPISVAVQASTALPGLYLPVEIDGRHYVDGVLRKTLHASVALEAGADLVICINPLVPVDTGKAIDEGVMRRGKLIHRGLPAVLSQSLRSMIRSRLSAGLAKYEKSHPDAEILLLEPRRHDYRMFFTNVFSFSSRRRVCEHAYESTRRELFERRRELVPLLRRHGLELRTDILRDPTRDFWRGVGLGEKDLSLGVFESLDRLLDRLEAVVDDAVERSRPDVADEPEATEGPEAATESTDVGGPTLPTARAV